MQIGRKSLATTLAKGSKERAMWADCYFKSAQSVIEG